MLRNGRLGSKHCVGNSDDSRVLAAQACKSHGTALAIVELEVDEALWEDEHVSLVQDLGDERVVWIRGNKANEERALQHRQDLCGTRVGVRWVHAAGGVVDADHRDPHRVQPRDLCDVDGRHG